MADDPIAAAAAAAAASPATPATPATPAADPATPVVPAAPAAPADPAAPAAAATPAAPATPASVVPEKYDLKLPADSGVDPAIVERTAATARALGLSNEAGQRLLDERVADITAQKAEAAKANAALIEAWKPGGAEFQKRNDAWTKEAQADPDVGGSPEKFADSVEKAQQALTKYGPELKSYLDETGLGSHPAAIKFLARIGRAMAEPGLVVGDASKTGRPKTDAEVLYPNHYQTGS